MTHDAPRVVVTHQGQDLSFLKSERDDRHYQVHAQPPQISLTVPDDSNGVFTNTGITSALQSAASMPSVRLSITLELSLIHIWQEQCTL